MSLVLKYSGPLPPARTSNKRKGEKHAIRRVFHEQLSRVPKKPYDTLFRKSDHYRIHEVSGFRFRPLICKDSSTVAEGVSWKLEYFPMIHFFPI
jgi:hypothetical protein